MTEIQDAVYNALNESNDNKIPNGAIKIKPYVYDALQCIDKNRNSNMSIEERTSKIMDICNKYKLSKTSKKQKKHQKAEDIDATLYRHSIIAEEIQQRIQHSINLAADELNIKVKYPQDNDSESDSFEEEEEEFVEIHENKLRNLEEIEEEEEDSVDDLLSEKPRTPPKPYNEKAFKEVESDYEEDDSDDLFVEECTPVVVRRN